MGKPYRSANPSSSDNAEKINGIWKYYFDPLKTAKYLNEYKEVTKGRV